jgi:hypothetical protein
MRPALLTIPFLFAIARGDTARADAGGAPASEALRGYVLVWHDAPFYADASDTSAHIRVAALPARKAGHAVPMHVVSTSGAFVEVEPVDDVHCTWSRLATTDDIAQLKLFVKRSDLAPVITRPHAKKFADGTSISLKAGVPVVAQADGWYAAALRGDELPVEVPAAAVGWSYTPERTKAITAITGRDFALAPRTKVTLGERTVVLTDAPTASSVERRGATALYAMEDRCVAATVAAPGANVRDSDEDTAEISTGGGYGVLDLRHEDYLPIGTPLVVDKRQVAMVVKPIYLPTAGTGKTVCFDRRIKLATALLPPSTDELDDRLRVCAATARVVHEKLRSSRSANGTTGR